MLRLKELREQRRLNQEGLALKFNVSQSTISAYEVGDRVPDLETLISIANFFNVSLDYLAGLSDLKQPIKQSDLSADELEHLYIYRQLNDIDREKVKAYIDGLQRK
ncbi:helix-turn-helix domain-containing protein [Blautia schinkii]|nr:helix-turn-helix domain-containing protein [Blautia schinkii]